MIGCRDGTKKRSEKLKKGTDERRRVACVCVCDGAVAGEVG